MITGKEDITIAAEIFGMIFPVVYIKTNDLMPICLYQCIGLMKTASLFLANKGLTNSSTGQNTSYACIFPASKALGLGWKIDSK